MKTITGKFGFLLFILICIFCVPVNSFANSYSSELNILMRKVSPSFNEIVNFIDNPPNYQDTDIERAIATGMLYKVEDTNVVIKLKKLAVDPSSKVRIATIYPLLSHTQELLASSVFKKEITEKGEFGFDTPTPFYAPNSFEEYKIEILKKNSTFLEELRRSLDIKNLDKMVKMRIAVTVYHTGYKELAEKIAKNILLEVYGDSPATSWAKWLLNGFE